jgi:hypothetical protein
MKEKALRKKAFKGYRIDDKLLGWHTGTPSS